MNDGHRIFQALSSCESLAMQRKVSQAVLQAYETGLNVGINSLNQGIPELLEENQKALRAIGFDMSPEHAAGLMAKALKFTIKEAGDEGE